MLDSSTEQTYVSQKPSWGDSTISSLESLIKMSKTISTKIDNIDKSLSTAEDNIERISQDYIARLRGRVAVLEKENHYLKYTVNNIVERIQLVEKILATLT